VIPHELEKTLGDNLRNIVDSLIHHSQQAGGQENMMAAIELRINLPDGPTEPIFHVAPSPHVAVGQCLRLNSPTLEIISSEASLACPSRAQP
jgi:hypothetical protein